MSRDPLLIFLVAGEPSGDVLGGRLMAALKQATGGAVRFAGVGGPAMRAQGLESLFPMAELSVMGIVEILPHARKLFRRMRETAAAVDAAAPDAVVTIDAPAFAHGVAKRIRNDRIPRIHYVAPQLWAWRPWRVHKFRRHFHHVLALLPFEPEWFARHGVDCRFVGHPVVESEIAQADGAGFRTRHAIDPEDRAICVLPGSRYGEVSRLADPFRETLQRLHGKHPELSAVIPTVPNVAETVKEAFADLPLRTIFVEAPEEKFSAMAACDVGLAASGTVTLELSMARVPYVVAYKVTTVTYWLASLLVRIPYANLINLTLDREIVPECIQTECEPEILFDKVNHLLDGAGAAQVAEMQPALEAMGLGGPSPSARAATAVLEIIQARAGPGKGPRMP